MRFNWMSRFVMCTLGTHTRPHYRNLPGLTCFWDPLLRQSLMAGLRILRISLRPCGPTETTETLWLLKTVLSSGGRPSSSPPQKGEKYYNRYMKDTRGSPKSQLRAHNCVYWPGINKDIQRMIKACETCQHFWPHQSHAPLKATPPPSRPWQRLGTDLFEFDRNDYIVIADYYLICLFCARYHEDSAMPLKSFPS